MPAQSLTIAQAVEQVLAELDGPISVKELMNRVLAIRPSQARDPTVSIRTHLRWEANGWSITYLDPKTVVPLRVVMRGVRLRVPISDKEAQSGLLYIRPSFEGFLLLYQYPERMQLWDESGRVIPTSVVMTEEPGLEWLNFFGYPVRALDMKEWFRARSVRSGGSILVTIEDWQTPILRLEYEPEGIRRKHHQTIRQKNKELADILYDILEHAYHEFVFSHIAVPTAYARLSDPYGYPGDHWIRVVQEDKRMQTNGTEIQYAGTLSPLERMVFQEMGEEIGPPEEPFSPEQGRRVYRFKAVPLHRPRNWKWVEIRGSQTLADLNAVLVSAFRYDWDHMAGFWKLVPRAGKRVREVELGDVDPLGEGTGASRRIAGLGMKPGETLKYVYDFGDWLEHTLTLEEIGEPEEGRKYPRVLPGGRRK